MTTPEALNALADRVEREEPSRVLDAEVLVACGHQAVNRGPRMGWEYRPNGVGLWRSMPSPMSSLDAAVALVPWDSVSWFTLQRAENGDWLPEIYLKGSGLAADGLTGADGIKTAAHALVPVALRARAVDMQARAVGAPHSSRTA